MADRRKTRRQVRESRRITHRQRGGAVWPSDSRLLSTNTQPLWQSVLRGHVDFGFLIDGGDKALTADKYATLIQKQDLLGDLMINAIRKHFGIEDGDNSTAIYTKITANGKDVGLCWNMIADFRKLLNFRDPIPCGDNIKSKFGFLLTFKGKDAIFNETMALIQLLLFPKLSKNILIETIAESFRSFFKNNELVSETGNNLSLRTLLGYQFENFSRSSAYTMTNMKLRDGFFIDACAPAESVTKSFWSTFIENVWKSRQTPASFDKTMGLQTSDPDTFRGDDSGVYAVIAASIYLHYEEKIRTSSTETLINNVLTTYTPFLKAQSTVPPPVRSGKTIASTAGTLIHTMRKDTFNNRERIVSGDQLDVPIINGTDITFGKLLSKFDPEQIHFILHLCHVLDNLPPEEEEEEEEEKKAASAPALPTIPGSGASTASITP